MKVTVDLDQELYRSVKVEAARADRSVRGILEEALRAWLDAAEEAEDRASAEAALAEYRRDGGEAADAWFGRLAWSRFNPDGLARRPIGPDVTQHRDTRP